MEDLKKQSRVAALLRRDNIAPSVRAHKSVSICTQLTGILDRKIAEKSQVSNFSFNVSVYQAMRSEVALDGFIEAAHDRKLNVCFPCMTDQKDFPMVMRSVSAHQFRQGKIPFLDHPMKRFPLDDEALNSYPLILPEQLDMIVVPLVAYDQNNNRLGYGGGNYDNYLPEVSPDCTIVGVAFSEQELSSVPINSQDYPLPNIVVS